MAKSERQSSEDLIRDARSRLRDKRPDTDRVSDSRIDETVAPDDPASEPTQHVYRSQLEEPSTVPEPQPVGPVEHTGRRWYTGRWVRAAVIAAVVLGYGLFTSIDDAERGSSGEIVGAGDLDVLTVQEGDCFDDPGATDVVFDLDAIPCTEPHDNEVFAVASITDAFGSDFPGVEALEDYSYAHCSGSVFEDFVGTPYLDSALEVFLLTPTEESWEQGDREIVCALFRLDFGKLTGSARGSGL